MTDKSRLDRDPVKKMIATSVQHHMVSDPKQRPPLMPQPSNVQAVEAHALDELNTIVRVDTDQGIRYFTIKVSETY